MAAACNRFAEPFNDVGVAVAMRVFQRDDEAARWNGAVIVVDAAPRVDIERSIRRERHLAGMANIVGEDRGAEAVGKSNTGRVAVAVGGLDRRCR